MHCCSAPNQKNSKTRTDAKSNIPACSASVLKLNVTLKPPLTMLNFIIVAMIMSPPNCPRIGYNEKAVVTPFATKHSGLVREDNQCFGVRPPYSASLLIVELHQGVYTSDNKIYEDGVETLSSAGRIPELFSCGCKIKE